MAWPRPISAASALNFEKVRMVQLRPACRIQRQDYLADGNTPLVDGKPVSCTFLDIVEEYNIINPASLLRDALSHLGMERDFTADCLDAVIHNHIVYRFHSNGANVIYYTAKALQEFRLGYMGFIQSAKLYTGLHTRGHQLRLQIPAGLLVPAPFAIAVHARKQ